MFILYLQVIKKYVIFLYVKNVFNSYMSSKKSKILCQNEACRNQTLTIKHCLVECPNRGTPEKNIQSIIRMLLGRNCEEKKIMMFLKEIKFFEETKIMDSQQDQHDLSSTLYHK